MAKVAVLDDQYAASVATSQAAGGYSSNGKLITKWNVSEVCNWLAQTGYGDLVPMFQKHQISGPVLPKLNDAVLKEMGVDIVGKRLLLMNEIVKIQAVARNEWRNQVIWSSAQYREGPCNNLLPYGFPCQGESCVGRPDVYTLTNSKLNILESKKNCNYPGFLWCGVSIDSNNIDLSDIVDVDVAAATAAYGDPLGVVKIRDNKGGFYVLALQSSQCQKANAIITNAREEATATAASMAIMR